jgi:hypothetical protein
MDNKKIVELCYGIRIDSGENHSDFFSTSNTGIQHQPVVFPPMDAQKRNDNIVMKLTNVNNLLNENIKFTNCTKDCNPSNIINFK